MKHKIDSNLKKTSYVIYGFMLLLTLFILIHSALSASWYIPKINYIHETISNDWQVTVDHQTSVLSLNQTVSNPNLSPIFMEHELPVLDDQTNWLMFYTMQAEVRVWIDTELVYQYNKPKSSTILPAVLPSRYHFVHLTPEYSGRTLRLEIRPTLPVVAGNLPEMYCASKNSLFRLIARMTFVPIFFSVILTCFSMWIIIQNLVCNRALFEPAIHLSHLAFLILDLCLWSLLESRIRQFIIPNAIFSTYLLDVAYFLIPVFFTNFLREFPSIRKDRVFTVLSYISCLQFIVVQLIVLTGVSFTRLILVMQLTLAAILLYLLWFSFTKLQKQQLTDDLRLLCDSSLFICLGAVAELLHFFIFTKAQSGTFLMLGVTFFAFYYSLCYQRNYLAKYITTLQEKQAIETELERSKAKLMLTQIQPHFLYNALSSIQTIIKINPDYAYNLLYDFSKHLRCTIRSISSDAPIPFSEEIQNIQAFINIEKMRFQDHLNVVYDIQCDSFMIIPLVIQPIAENGIKHGIFQRGKEGGTITIRSYEEPDYYVIQVIDTGVGFDVASLNSEKHSDSIGVKNVKFRLENIMHAEMHIDSIIGTGTTVTVKIPKSFSQKNGIS